MLNGFSISIKYLESLLQNPEIASELFDEAYDFHYLKTRITPNKSRSAIGYEFVYFHFNFNLI
tara:strand:- start:288 stop:476 length:189 start_codon:yes stop_codon:yes gene_type:complete